MRTRARILLVFFAVALLLAPALWAQGRPTASIGGQVSTADGEALPGVTVTFESEVLQGTEVTTTGEGGYYTSPPMPPGVYVVTFELVGYQPVGRQVRASVDTELPLDVELTRAAVAEEIVVSGAAIETVSEGMTSSQTITNEVLEELPTARTYNAAVLLTPGVHDTGPKSNPDDTSIIISGAQSWENLFTMNGVVLNENLRGGALDLFIEDAIQETTTKSAGVSAEYGRFAGGVVTAVTKSGGNQFSGSLRDSFTNDDWQGDNEFSPTRQDVTNETYEATLGGRFIRDRLWFFGAGRDVEREGTEVTTLLNIQYPTTRSQERWELKLTGSVTPKHQLQVSRTEIEDIQGNVAHGGLDSFAVVLDDSIDPSRSTPQELNVYQYTGLLTNNFFVEAQYGERQFTFEDGGGVAENLAEGTPVFDLAEGVVYNDSLFCNDCRPEERDNEQARAKGTWFLSTADAGAHDLVFGYETFTDIRAADNHQSANDLMVWNFVPSRLSGNDVFPVFLPGGATFLMYLPILNPTQGTDFQTDSVFANDSWRLNDAWSFNLGVRYDATEAVNSNGAKVADDTAFSPRLGASWTPGGDSEWSFFATAGRYVGPQTGGVFDNSSPAGNPAAFYFLYNGPPIGLNNLVEPEAAVGQAFNWLFDQCPAVQSTFATAPGPPDSLDAVFGCPFMVLPVIPGATTLLDEGLSPTSADELTLGMQRDIGTTGTVRADLIWREWGDFFLTQRDLTTGPSFTDENGNTFDRGFIVNDDDLLVREYLGLNLAANFALLDRKLRLGGNLTLSESEGNFDGETAGSGPVTSTLGAYPEYRERRWNAPEGPLSIDQPVKANLYGVYEIFSTEHHRLSGSLVQNFFSGTPYSAFGTIQTVDDVVNPGYANPVPSGVTYFFSDRGEFRTDDITRTDVSLNYSFRINRWELFVQPEMLNAFNEDSVRNVNTTVSTANDTGALDAFNPFTEQPVEGVHWQKGPDFGQPTSEDDLQFPRLWRFSVGIRFNP